MSTPTVPVVCCYCGTKQRSLPPPVLHDCLSCKRGFRVLANASGAPAMELTQRARNFFVNDSLDRRGA